MPQLIINGLQEVARAALPLAGAENTQIVAFESPALPGEQLAILINPAQLTNTPLVRVHSSCVTGDLLGSLRCDCGDQLSQALEQMKASSGILIYLLQEGRGIGLVNKLRAYVLQDQGADTYTANEQLGFAADARDFAVAADILKHLGYTQIQLLTNNPNKAAQLEKYGIQIVERLPLQPTTQTHNRAYLTAKQKRGQHLLDLEHSAERLGEPDTQK